MYPLRFGLLSIVAIASLSATALAAAPSGSAPATGEAAGHDHIHASAGGAAEPAAATTDMMQKMQAMHAKVMASKSPEERAALMKEHMATMHEGMSMMQNMPKPSGNNAESQRMDMMQMMMQMMMDHMSMDVPMAMPGTHKPEAPK